MDSLWVSFTLVSAFTLATSDALTKKVLTLHNVYLTAWLRLLFPLPLLAAALFFVRVPALDGEFYKASLAALPLEIIAVILYSKALKVSPLGLTLPFLSMTPLFLIGFSYIILGERVSLSGAFGILLTAIGGYILNLGEFRKGILEPIIAIKKEKGSVFMILVALIYSVTSPLGKTAIEHSSPIFFGIAYYTVLAFAFAPVALYKGRNEIGMISSAGVLKKMVLPGVSNAVMVLSHMLAMSMTEVAYMIAVKRVSLLIGVLYGYLFFGETAMRQRLAGTVLMFSGFLLILLFR
jgi:drug/metabolite transporter (DMT)-like permease